VSTPNACVREVRRRQEKLFLLISKYAHYKARHVVNERMKRTNPASPGNTPERKRPAYTRQNATLTFMTTAMDTSATTTSSRGTRGTKRRFSGARTGAPLSKRQRSEVNSLIHRQQELKYFSAVATATAVTVTGAITGVPFDVPQGDTDQSRDGDQLMWCGHIDLKLQCVNGQGATADIYNNIRYMIFQWHPSSTPTSAAILLNGPSGAPDIYSNYNHDQRQQYLVLFDRVFTTVGAGNTAPIPNTNIVTTGLKTFRVSLERATKKAQYQAGGATGTNRLYVLYLSDSALATHPTLAYATKVVFRDS